MGFPEPHLVHQVYLERMARGDGACPDDPVNITDSHVYGCTAEDGTFYMGVAEFHEGEDYRLLTGDFLIRDPEGTELEVGGGFEVQTAPGQEALTLMGSVRDEARTDWLGRGASFILEASLGEVGETVLHGGVGIGEAALDLRELHLVQGCETGTLALRGPDMRWYEAELDCGCGELAFEGQPLGGICPELGPMHASLDAPFHLPELP